MELFRGDDRILGMKNLITAIDADRLIYTIRGRRVMLDADLAMIYGVPTKRLNEQVRRNQERFPEDFAFPLAPHEAAALNRSQFATGSQKHRDPRSLPVAFTEHGAIMLASVLKSPIAVAASISVVRAFNRLRQIADKHKELASALDKLEREVRGHAARADSRLDEHIESIKTLFAVIHEIMEPPIRSRKRIGFNPE